MLQFDLVGSSMSNQIKLSSKINILKFPDVFQEAIITVHEICISSYSFSLGSFKEPAGSFRSHWRKPPVGA